MYGMYMLYNVCFFLRFQIRSIQNSEVLFLTNRKFITQNVFLSICSIDRILKSIFLMKKKYKWKEHAHVDCSVMYGHAMHKF